MSALYELVSSNDDSSDPIASPRKRSRRNYWVIFLGTISLANFCMLMATVHFWRAVGHAESNSSNFPLTTPDMTSILHDTELHVPDGLASVDVLPIAYVPFHWNTPWGAPEATDADSLWENVNTAHGHIAVDHKWAADNNVSLPT